MNPYVDLDFIRNIKEIGDYFGYENLPDDDEFIDHLFGIVACNGMSITGSSLNILSTYIFYSFIEL